MGLRLTVTLVVAALLTIDVAVALAILLVVSALLAVLRVIVLTVILCLLVLVVTAIGLLARLERVRSGLEGGGARSERLGGRRVVVVEVHLLRLARQVVILSSGVVFPRVEIRHGGGSLACLALGRNLVSQLGT